MIQMVILIILEFLFVLIACSVTWTLLKKVVRSLPSKKSKKIHSYLKNISYNNLKSEYSFIDHAIDEYSDEQSSIMLVQNLELNSLSKEYIEKLRNYINKDKLNEAINFVDRFTPPKELERKCIGLNFIMHNRDQRRQNDEAHWFKIECISVTRRIRLISQQLSNEINQIENINQPETINKLTPLISTIQFFCSLITSDDNFFGCKFDKKINSYIPYKIIKFDSIFNSKRTVLSINDGRI